MRIAITGATGNVGSALLRRLTPTNQHSIVGLARRLPEDHGDGQDTDKRADDHAGDPTAGRVATPAPAQAGGSGGDPLTDSADAVEWRPIDLTSDACAGPLRDAFRGADAVVHLAWGFQPSHDQRYLEELGVGGTRRVLEAVADVGVPHLVHMSSVGAYSAKHDDDPVDETWPTGGVPSSPYSRHKSAAERLLDAHERAGHGTVVTRLRPGIIGQRSAGSALLRYGVPAYVPAKVLDLLPLLPLDRRLAIPMVHADDVADAIERVLQRRAGGAFNLAAAPPITTETIAQALGARAVHVPAQVVRTAMSAAWHARLQQVDPGWLDLGFAVPLLDTSRAARELDWSPTVDAVSVLRETLAGMRDTSADGSDVLRHRSVLSELSDWVRRGPVSERHRP